MNIELHSTVSIIVVQDNPFGVSEAKNSVKYRMAELLGLKIHCGEKTPIGLTVTLKDATPDEISDARSEACTEIIRVINAVNEAYEKRVV